MLIKLDLTPYLLLLSIQCENESNQIRTNNYLINLFFFSIKKKKGGNMYVLFWPTKQGMASEVADRKSPIRRIFGK